MPSVVAEELGKTLPKDVVNDLLDTKLSLTRSLSSGDFPDVLLKGARFAEHCLRMLEFIRTGSSPAEIKSFARTVEALRNDAGLPETIRLTIPRMIEGSLWELRNRRDHIHVKELDPSLIDASIVSSVTDWVLAELLRIYSNLDEHQTYKEMSLLVEPTFPNVVEVLGELAFSKKLLCHDQVLTVVCRAGESGISRSEIGKTVTYKPGSVSHSLKTLTENHLIHYSKGSKLYVALPDAVFALRKGVSEHLKQSNSA